MPPLEAVIVPPFPLPMSFNPSWIYRLWWLKTSNPSARNTRLKRSVIGKVFCTEASTFHAPGPRNALRDVMSAGHGPQSEAPRRFGLDHELAAGKVPTT